MSTPPRSGVAATLDVAYGASGKHVNVLPHNHLAPPGVEWLHLRHHPPGPMWAATEKLINIPHGAAAQIGPNLDNAMSFRSKIYQAQGMVAAALGLSWPPAFRPARHRVRGTGRPIRRRIRRDRTPPRPGQACSAGQRRRGGRSHARAPPPAGGRGTVHRLLHLPGAGRERRFGHRGRHVAEGAIAQLEHHTVGCLPPRAGRDSPTHRLTWGNALDRVLWHLHDTSRWRSNSS